MKKLRKEVGVGKSLHWEWDVALEVENSSEDHVCEKNYNAQRNFGIQTNHLVMLIWAVDDIDIATKSL